jgi:hypothetical protein
MSGRLIKVKLRDIAYARSGDKGNTVNVGVIAYTSVGYERLRQALTVEVVAAYLAGLGASSVKRFEIESLGALNFVLEGALAGGGSRSLRVDAQGKAVAVALLEMPMAVPEEIYSSCVRRPGEGGV